MRKAGNRGWSSYDLIQLREDGAGEQAVLLIFDLEKMVIERRHCLAGGKPDRAGAAGLGTGNERITRSGCRLAGIVKYVDVGGVHGSAPPAFEKGHDDKAGQNDRSACNGVDRGHFSEDKQADQGCRYDMKIEHRCQKTGIGPSKGADEEELRGRCKQASHNHQDQFAW